MKCKVLKVKCVDEECDKVFETRLNAFLQTIGNRFVSITISHPTDRISWFIATIIYADEVPIAPAPARVEKKAENPSSPEQTCKDDGDIHTTADGRTIFGEPPF